MFKLFDISGYYRDQKHYNYHSDHGHNDYIDHGDHHYYKEKSDEVQTTASPITPDELRDRLERLFITNKDHGNDQRDDGKVINARNYQWTPISSG
ncbi:jg14456 [Pararge aegeria aegeria]|uniref:Jg14456 protein n=1 Tax=Pararge aegeria aegeria TaxID=348720 RepID=A0A8S4QDI6_9NEOP|nr:jg14456 [Pararge aegeria aegeria]